MRKSRFNDSQRQAILDSYLNGNKTVEAICEEQQISPATFYKWKNEVEVEKNDDPEASGPAKGIRVGKPSVEENVCRVATQT